MAREERELTDARWAMLEPLLPRNALAPVRLTRTTAKSGSARVAAAHRRALAGPARPLWSPADGRLPLLPLTSPGRVRPAAGRGHPPRRRPRRAGLVDALRGWQRGPRPPARRRRPMPADRKGGSAHPQGEAPGRSRGGLSSKLHLRVEGGGRPPAILVTAGQRPEAPLLPALLDAWAVKRSGPEGCPGRGRPRKRPQQLAADTGTRIRACGRSCAALGSAR
jgi:hypothetical protein